MLTKVRRSASSTRFGPTGTRSSSAPVMRSSARRGADKMAQLASFPVQLDEDVVGLHGRPGGQGQLALRQLPAAAGQHLAAVGEGHLERGQLVPDDVHRLLQGRPVPHPPAEIGQALLGDEQGHRPLLHQLDGQVPVQPVQYTHKGDQPQGIHQDLWQQDGLLQGGGGLEGLGQQQDQAALDQLGHQSEKDQVAGAPGPAGEPPAAQCPHRAEAEGADAAGQGGKARRIVEIAVQPAEGPGTQAADGAAHQPRRHGAHHPGVHHRPLKGQARVSTADGQHPEDGPQHQLAAHRAILTLQDHPQGAHLR